MSVLRGPAGFVLGWLVRLWASTWRVTIVGGAAAGDSARVFAFWHGQQMALTRVRRARPTAVMVSWSRDGALQSGVMRALGLAVVRGSASRGGAAALRALVRLARRGHDLAFAVDGPRGPLHAAKPGATAAAELAGASLHPVACAASPALTLERAWDRFEIPLPFARVVVVIGAPLRPGAAAGDGSLLSTAIEHARRHALRQLHGDPRVQNLVGL